jgi:hypothetical protein
MRNACFILLLVAGCAQLDRAATGVREASTQPIVVAVTEGNPIATLIVGLLGAVSSVYLSVRGKRWKEAFVKVVETVEPFIPTNEPERDKLKLAQGEKLTELVKATKAKA